MVIIRVRGRALPDGEYVDLYADGDRWTSAVVYAEDLRQDLGQLDHPVAVILRGVRVR